MIVENQTLQSALSMIKNRREKHRQKKCANDREGGSLSSVGDHHIRLSKGEAKMRYIMKFCNNNNFSSDRKRSILYHSS